MSSADESGERKTVIMGKPLTTDMVLKTLGGVSLAVSGWFLKAVWEKSENHETRLIKVEMRADQSFDALQEIKTDVKDIKREIGRKEAK